MKGRTPSVWQWYRLTFGQSVFLPRRQEPKDLSVNVLPILYQSSVMSPCSAEPTCMDSRFRGNDDIRLTDDIHGRSQTEIVLVSVPKKVSYGEIGSAESIADDSASQLQSDSKQSEQRSLWDGTSENQLGRAIDPVDEELTVQKAVEYVSDSGLKAEAIGDMMTRLAQKTGDGIDNCIAFAASWLGRYKSQGNKRFDESNTNPV